MVVDRFVPSFDWAFVPVTAFAGMIEDFQSYARIHEQNQELKRELQQMKAWKEAALQLEQENAKLLALNEMQLEPKLTYIGGVVLEHWKHVLRGNKVDDVNAPAQCVRVFTT